METYEEIELEIQDLKDEIRGLQNLAKIKEARLRVVERRLIKTRPCFLNEGEALKAGAPVWKDKEERYWPIDRMTETHLNNTIAWLKKSQAGAHQRISDGFRALGQVHGEMAELAIEDGITSLENDIDDMEDMLNIFNSEKLRREGVGGEWDGSYIINE
jgi:hypothetical protein